VSVPPAADPARRLLADELADRIQALIIDGTYGPGDRLPAERELAEQLGANRGSVREALKKLEQLRLVDIQQGSGIRVRPLEEASLDLVMRMLLVDGRPNLPWIRDLMDLREALVPAVMRLAVERASAAELEEFSAHLQNVADPALSDAGLQQALGDMGDLSARMTQNRVVLLLTNSLRRFFEQAPLSVLNVALAMDRATLVPGLKRLAVAVDARDADSAVRATRDLLRRAHTSVLDALGDAKAEASEVDPPGPTR
jgi:GntR family transcriptional repressor for pyruvate dehydrogenase complex